MDKLLVVASLVLAHVDGLCNFPARLRGSWYEKGQGQINITAGSMTKKGYCVENADDSFLLENRGIGCFQCLKIFERHRNVIQYRESYCVGKDTISNICSQVSENALLYTLVREPAMAVRCPFRDAFHFQYNNNTGGWCRNPTSYVKQCASNSKFRFHFKRCPTAAYTYRQELDYECLATWRDGSEQYLYGRFGEPGMESVHLTYRCFMYQILGTLVYVAMSGDATCRGLRSPRDGSLVMEFTKDVFNWPEPKCNFPSWVTRYTWRDLSGRHMYLTNTQGSVISIRYRFMDDTSEIRGALRCITVNTEDANTNRFIALSFTSDDCTPTYQCIMFLKRRDGVTELHQGSFMEYDTDVCRRIHLSSATKYLLIPAPTTVVSCPFPGFHKMNIGNSKCSGYIQSGCNGSSTMEIISPCASQPKVALECLKTWGGSRKTFIVASRLNDRAGVANCFSMKMKGSMLQFSTDKNCNMGTTDIFNIAIKYFVSPESERCIMRSSKPNFKPEVESRHNSERDTSDKKDKQEGQYKHVKPSVGDSPQSQLVANSATSAATQTDKNSSFLHYLYKISDFRSVKSSFLNWILICDIIFLLHYSVLTQK